jgi:hypothetical protein
MSRMLPMHNSSSNNNNNNNNKDPSVLYATLATEIAHLLRSSTTTSTTTSSNETHYNGNSNHKSLEDGNTCRRHGSCLISWACQTAVLYYFMSQKSKLASSSASSQANARVASTSEDIVSGNDPKRLDFPHILKLAATGRGSNSSSTTNQRKGKTKHYPSRKNPALVWLESLPCCNKTNDHDNDDRHRGSRTGSPGSRGGLHGSGDGISYADLCTLAGGTY